MIEIPRFPEMFPQKFGFGGKVSNIPWYLAGGVPLANVIAAYQPIAEDTLAASYINIVNPATHILSAPVGSEPGFTVGAGWTFGGPTPHQRIITDIIPANGYSMVIYLLDTYVGTTNIQSPVGEVKANARFLFANDRDLNPDSHYFQSGQSVTVSGTITDGVAGIAGQQGYKDGVADGAAIAAWSDTTTNVIYIGCANNSGTPAYYFTGTIKAIAFYDITLTPAQMAAVSAAIKK